MIILLASGLNVGLLVYLSAEKVRFKNNSRCSVGIRFSGQYFEDEHLDIIPRLENSSTQGAYGDATGTSANIPVADGGT